MENKLHDFELRVQTLENELECLRQAKELEESQRQQLQKELQRTLHKLEMSKAKIVILREKWSQSQYRVQELETAFHEQRYTSDGSPEEPEDDDIIEIVEISKYPSISQPLLPQASSSSSHTTDHSDGMKRHQGKFAPTSTHENLAESFYSTDDILLEEENVSGSEQDLPCSNLRNTVCGYCGQEQVELKAHIEEVHRQLGKWSCFLCTKMYCSRQNLKFHYESDHRNTRYDCGLCDRHFKNPYNAKYHMKKCARKHSA